MFQRLLTSSLMLCALLGSSSAITINTGPAAAANTASAKLLRKSYTSASAEERECYLNSVVSLIKKDGKWYSDQAATFSKNFAKIAPDLMLPWIRAALIAFEEKLHKYGNNGKGILYFDPSPTGWTNPTSPIFKDYGCPNSGNNCVRDGIFAKVQIPYKGCIRRGAPAVAANLPSVAVQSRLIADSKSLQDISDRLQGGYLGPLHNSVGGTYATADSAYDPLYYLLEPNVDRLWYTWQERNPSSCKEYKVGKADSNCDLPGFPNTKVKDVQDISKLPYSYDH